MVEFSKFTRTEKTLSFHIKGLDTSIVNALRRTLLTDIPVATIRFIPNRPDANDIVFHKNTTNLHNEFLGHRISMIPLGFSRTELRNFQPKNYKFVLDETNTSSKPMNITTEHIKIYDQRDKLYPQEVHDHIFRKNHITGKKILITKLLPSFELHFEAYPSIGTAREWASWSAVSQSVHEFVVDEDAAAIAEDEHIREYTKDAGDSKISKERESELRHDFRTLNKYRFFKKDDQGNPTEFKFSIESECGISCDELVDMAFEVIGSNLTKVFDDTYAITYHDERMIRVSNINHTLGHMIMWYMYTYCDDVSYVGYNMPHPLEECCNFKITLKNDAKKIDQVFKEEVQKLKQYMDGVRAAWQGVMVK